MFRRFYLFDSRRRFLIWITIDVVQQGEHFDMVGTENDLEYSGYFIIWDTKLYVTRVTYI